jgi:hypothetical protein
MNGIDSFIFCHCVTVLVSAQPKLFAILFESYSSNVWILHVDINLQLGLQSHRRLFVKIGARKHPVTLSLVAEQ